MNPFDPTTPGPGRPPLDRVLGETLGALADGATPPGSPSAPERNLPALRRFVRRRRAVKATGTALGVAACVAAAGVLPLLLPRLDKEPVPAQTVSPTASPEPSPTASPDPTATASPSPSPAPVELTPVADDPAFLAGEVPRYWWTSHDMTVTCGMPLADLAAQTSDVDLTVTATGKATTRADDGALEVPVSVTTGEGVDPGLQGFRPMLVWVRDEVVVDAGPSQSDGGPEWSAGALGRVHETAAFSYEEWGCGESDDLSWDGPYSDEYATPRPAGTYELYVAATWTEEDGSGGGMVLSEQPVPVTLAEAAPPAGTYTRGFPQEAVFSHLFGTNLTCGLPAADLSAASDPRYTVEVTGEATSSGVRWEVPLRVTARDAGAGPEPVTASMVWLQDGVVVDVGIDWLAHPNPTLRQGRVDTAAVGTVVSTCHPERNGYDFRTFREPGEYEVVVLARIGDPTAGEPAVVVSDPVTVVVGERGRS